VRPSPKSRQRPGSEKQNLPRRPGRAENSQAGVELGIPGIESYKSFGILVEVWGEGWTPILIGGGVGFLKMPQNRFGLTLRQHSTQCGRVGLLHGTYATKVLQQSLTRPLPHPRDLK
jgi:hypothetical protein